MNVVINVTNVIYNLTDMHPRAQHACIGIGARTHALKQTFCHCYSIRVRLQTILSERRNKKDSTVN